jgi:hypothetical protein
MRQERSPVGHPDAGVGASLQHQLRQLEAPAVAGFDQRDVQVGAAVQQRVEDVVAPAVERLAQQVLVAAAPRVVGAQAGGQLPVQLVGPRKLKDAAHNIAVEEGAVDVPLDEVVRGAQQRRQPVRQHRVFVRLVVVFHNLPRPGERPVPQRQVHLVPAPVRRQRHHAVLASPRHLHAQDLPGLRAEVHRHVPLVPVPGAPSLFERVRLEVRRPGRHQQDSL